MQLIKKFDAHFSFYKNEHFFCISLDEIQTDYCKLYDNLLVWDNGSFKIPKHILIWIEEYLRGVNNG
jgi:hypothetical protein